MKRLITLAVAIALAAPAIHAQAIAKQGDLQCRDLKDNFNILEPDEILLNGQVCKKAVLRTASRDEVPEPPASGTALTQPPATATRMAQEVKVPAEPGLYAVLSEGALRHVAGRPTSFVRTGSRLASDLTAGIHARRMNTQIAGKSAYVTVSPRPTFYYRIAPNAPDQVVPGTLSLILTKMSVKQRRRQFELDADGILRHSQGISVRHQDNFDVEEMEPGVFKLNPDTLPRGQYAFFLYIAGPGENDEGTRERATSTRHAGGEALRGFLYDFQVE